MKQIFDLLLSIAILVFLATPMLLIAFAVRLTSKDSHHFIGLIELEKIIYFLKCQSFDQ